MAGAAIRLENVAVVFNEGTPNEVLALDRINLEVRPAELVVILGPNGSGKSTLLKVIAGLVRPTQGKIFVNGKDVTNQQDYERAQNVSFVHQDPLMGTCPGLTLFENITLSAANRWWRALPYPARLRYVQLPAFDLAGMVFHDRLSLSMTSFSGGQRQALASCMAFNRSTPLVMLDEFISSLDDPTAERITHLAQQLSQYSQSTLLMILHDLDRALQIGARTLILVAGRLVHDLRPSDIQEMDRAVLSQYLLPHRNESSQAMNSPILKEQVKDLPTDYRTRGERE